MPVDAIGRASNVESSGLNNNVVDIEEFLQIFLTQLNFQDPLEPVDNREFMAQLAQFSSVEIANRTNENIENLLNVVSVDQSIGLIGKSVELNTQSGPMDGRVTTIRFVSGNPRITVQLSDGTFIQDLNPAQINLVRN